MEALLPSSISPKISAILQSHVYPRVGHVLRALARFKSALLGALRKTKRGAAARRRKGASIGYRRSRSSSWKRSKKQQQQQVASRGGGLATPHHLAWSGGLSSPDRRAASEEEEDVRYYHVYPSYESAWNAVVGPAGVATAGGGEVDGDGTAAEYCGYLRWLEEEVPDELLVVEEYDEGEEGDGVDGAGGENEIDRLAERFIARCHANFLLEKQESYDRRCQEMIARSM
ncbi:hypothetical protein U9M48_034188 [Paspalum notatum var. saurae]|uniref:Uncharacterized protein n=1 Tax=Paspalum notatum var. saurae TaxID=547442 RepID=A0AAQ3U8T3_PASNO